MEERRGNRGSPGRKRTGQSPGVELGKRRSPNNAARSRSPEKRSSKPKERVGPAKPKETAIERKEREEKEAKEKKEKEEQEYQERLSKLSTPEREVRVDLSWFPNQNKFFSRSWRLGRRSLRQGLVSARARPRSPLRPRNRPQAWLW